MTSRPGAGARRSARMRIAGVPVRFRASWFLVSGAIVLLFGPQVQRIFPELGLLAYAVALGYALLLMLSVLAHELAHALAARSFGWPATEIELNLWGGHTEFLAHRATPVKSLAVSLAGPAANLVIAGLGWYFSGLFELTGVAALLVQVTVLVNFMVGVFNLLPGLPLDGGRIVESAVWGATGSQDRGLRAAGWGGRVVVVLLLSGLAVLVITGVREISLVVVVVAVMVSFFLWQGASESIKVANARLIRSR
ncbi:site-2 protease family protein [Nesterenkonia halotolerans]|uniref:Zn-dependent protease n=1 Tax=Nesterenkonia halotolerans TaxID=225325 RepID=A0ABR9J5E8_9MICC|nr:site-2 protease family protein [Nesterenkonia halotolerans]MBE1513821.1 Zn-dependent protease [Nesterenkonia halotolerans]